MKAIKRLQIVHRHINPASCAYSTPAIQVTPKTSLVDEKVDIIISGLKPKQTVTIVAITTENRQTFQSRCVMTADEHGKIHNHRNPSLAGTFKGIQPMGLFWAMTPNSGVRLTKKNVSEPLTYSINVYDGSHPETVLEKVEPLLSTSIERLFKRPGVKRILVIHERFRGMIFVPEGDGPFPGLIDMYGGLISLIETRAALLASHGYATLALSYLYGEGLPKMLLSADIDYLQGAAEWFCQQNYVDSQRFGAFGHCFGGSLCLVLASMLPEIKAVVNINGIAVHAGKMFDQKDYADNKWPNPCRVFRTNEGVIIKDVYETDTPSCVPCYFTITLFISFVFLLAWQHGAKVLVICGEDDKQVHPKWHEFYQRHWPEKFKSNFELVTYPGAGHLIDPPYIPLTRTMNAGPQRMSTIDFIQPEFYHEALLSGGYPRQHAYAEEDSWKRILTFLHDNLKTLHCGSKTKK